MLLAQVIPCCSWRKYGFNAGLAAPGNLSKGYDSLSQDFDTIVWRLKQLGFNAIRLPFSFKHFQVRQRSSNIQLQHHATALLCTACW